MSNPRQVSVVIVSYNTRDLLLESAASVFASCGDASIELIVVDNASQDGSYDAIRKAHPQAAVVRNQSNLGFAAACNQGIRLASAPLILLLNSDAQLTATAFEALCACLNSDDRCGAAGCRLLDWAGREMTNTRNFLTPLNQALETAGLKVRARSLRRTYKPKLDTVDCSVDWIDGACLMLRREALDEIGLLDERFFIYSEDEDLCLRLRTNNWSVCFSGVGTAVHHGAASTSQHRTDMLRHFYLSQLLFLEKHRGGLSTYFFALAMNAVLLIKRWLLPGSTRRESARHHLKALRDARARFHRAAA